MWRRSFVAALSAALLVGVFAPGVAAEEKKAGEAEQATDPADRASEEANEKTTLRIILRPEKREGEKDPNLAEMIRAQIEAQIRMQQAGEESEAPAQLDEDLIERLCACVKWNYTYDDTILPPGKNRPIGESEIAFSFAEDPEYGFSETRSFLTTRAKTEKKPPKESGNTEEAADKEAVEKDSAKEDKGSATADTDTSAKEERPSEEQKENDQNEARSRDMKEEAGEEPEPVILPTLSIPEVIPAEPEEILPVLRLQDAAPILPGEESQGQPSVPSSIRKATSSLPVNKTASAQVRMTHTGSKGSTDVTTLYQRFLQKQAERGQGIDPSSFIPSRPANDGVYTVRVRKRDQDGIERTEEERITVNRFGSVYRFDDNLRALLGKTVRSVSQELTLYEYNPDTLEEDSNRLEITRDGTRLENIRYELRQIAAGEGGAGAGPAHAEDKDLQDWAGYAYVLSPENFAEDGQYRIRLSSLDTAGNHSELHRYNGGEATFAVDGTAPVLEDSEGWEKELWEEDAHTIRFGVFDAMGLAEITVYVDGKQAYHRTTFDDPYRQDALVTVKQGEDQKVLLMALDEAGNMLREEKTLSVMASGIEQETGDELPANGISSSEGESGGGSGGPSGRPSFPRRAIRVFAGLLTGAMLAAAILLMMRRRLRYA